jgi:hypothetical protein
MNKTKTVIGFLVLAIMLHACIETFYPDIAGHENVLVVDGMVTDEERPSLVRLSRTFSYDDHNYHPESGATVIILDDKGTPHYLEEKKAGGYYTDSATFRGEAGGRYQLQIILADGTTYQSDYVTLKKAPPVESFDVRYEQKETRDRDDVIHGIQFYLNTHDPQNETRYYRWEWVETWEFTVPMQAPGKADRSHCWKSHESRSILIGNTNHLTADRIIDYPLHYVSTESNRLRILYSLLVRQYAISQAAYEFWKTHDDLGENAGTLFDPIPTRVAGNIYNISEPGEPVLGYFEACGVSTRRIFVSNDLIPKNVSIPSEFEFCKFLVLVDPPNLPYLLNSGWMYVDEYYDMNKLIVRLTNSPKCFDCTLTGSNERPDYWPAEQGEEQ